MFRRWLESLERRRAQRSYVRVLGPLLRKRYGPARHYSVGQVRTTAQSAGLNMLYLCYGYAEFCSEPDFNAFHESIGESCDYLGMRGAMDEVAPSGEGHSSGGGWSDWFDGGHGSGHDSGGSGDSGSFGDSGGGHH